MGSACSAGAATCPAGPAAALKLHEVMGRHGGELARWVRWQFPSVDVDAVVADVWLVVWRRSEVVPDDAAARWGWLVRTATFVALRQLRSERRYRGYCHKVESQPSGAAPDVEAGVVDGEMDRVLRSMLVVLSERDRELLVWSWWDGVSNTEIAARCGMTPNAVAMRLLRATRRLADACAPLLSAVA